MLNKTTSKGTLTQRPLPNDPGVYGTYFFCTDCDGGTYYYSNGESWVVKTLDVTDLSPETDAQVMCGIASDNTINPVKLDSFGVLRTTRQGAFTNKSGTITAGGTSQNIAAYHADRNYFFFQNVSDTTMYLNLSANATTSSIPVAANGGTFVWDNFAPINPINVFCAATGKAFVAFEA